MNPNDPFFTHLASLAVALYPRYINYLQESGFGEADGGSFSAAEGFLQKFFPVSLRRNLERLGEAAGLQIRQGEVVRWVQSVMVMLDIFAWKTEQPEFLKCCDITHPNCVKFSEICVRLLCFAQNYLVVNAVDSGYRIRMSGEEQKLAAQEECRLWEQCQDAGLALSPDCIHAMMLAALLLAEYEEERGK